MFRQRVHKILEDICLGLFDHALAFGSANIPPTDTGLPCRVWINTFHEGRHCPRIKIESQGQFYAMTIDDRPSLKTWRTVPVSFADIDKTRQWILLNQDVLLDYWYDKISTHEALLRLRKIS